MSTHLADVAAALDGEELLHELEELGQIGRNERGGVDRLAFSAADRAGREWLRERMRAAGLAPLVDAAGNSIARIAGSEPDLAPIALGSHSDSVPDGGRFDGALGVLAALAAARALIRAGVRLRHPLELIDFTGEEATVPGGTLGSRAMAGLLPQTIMAEPAWDGRSLGTLLSEAGLAPAKLGQAARPAGALAAFLELHIEQGGALEAADVPIGIVEGIVGIRRYRVLFQGQANHAGTTPMAGRRDALVLAAPFIGAVRDIVVAHGIVGTVGTLALHPNAPNVIPGEVLLGLELRGLDELLLDRVAAELGAYAEACGGSLSERSRKPSVRCDPRVMAAVEDAGAALGLACRRMPSGAGHDAMCMAALAPVGMIFVPSRAGISHAPAEWTEPAHCVAGARVLLAALLALDKRLD